MAIDDPESSLAETRAWERWHNAPWPEAVALTARKQESLFTPIEMQEAFRQGFRAGQEHPTGRGVGEMRVVAPADSPLGVELSKIRDRLNALETKVGGAHGGLYAQGENHNARLEALERMHEGQPEKTTRWEMAIEGRLDSITERANEQGQRIEALENHPERLGSSEKHIDRRVEAVEKDWVQTAALVTELQGKVGDMLSGEAQADLESRVSDIEERERGTLVRLENHGQRIGVLEACLKSGGCWAHLPFPDADAHMDERQRECFAQMQEAKLRLLEPVG
jgi:hypothetical protein